VLTGGGGITGGFFATNRVSLVNSAGNECVYASDAATGDIVGINVNTMEVSGSASGSTTDSGATNGIGLAMNGQYLYASFTASNTIGTFQVQSDCSLSFVNDVTVVGLQAGFINGMAVHGNLLVATFGDGSIASFDISSGTPVSNNDEQNSTGYVKSQGTAYPNEVEITKDGHFAIFGDTSTSTTVEVSDISTGRLNTTVVYPLGTAINSSNILLSPDETLLYISNTQGAKITAAFFDKTTGKLSPGCTSGSLRGYSSKWSYLAGLALDTNAGTGDAIYVAEFGSPSYIAMVEVSSSGGRCSLQEFPGSPISDANSLGLLSIGTFPPRDF
jgi:6-phosphogluconolactonase (cycloisomerase 2 family)